MILDELDPTVDDIIRDRQEPQARHGQILSDGVEGLGRLPGDRYAPGICDHREKFGEDLRRQAEGQFSTLCTFEECAGGGVFGGLRKNA